MNTAQIWTNITVYVLQIGALVGIGAALPALFRLGGGRAPAARLLYWQVLLVACLALPWLRPWQSEVIAISAAPLATTNLTVHFTPTTAPHSAFPPLAVMALWLLAAGAAVRMIWLALGLLKLARHRRHGHALQMPPEWTGIVGDTTLLVSDEVAGPVTFGLIRPVVLLPAGFPSMPEAMREAILYHELLHVERRDWLFTLGEEIIRAVFWFHPAIWWVLGEIQLAREQTVDQAVIDVTQARDPYVDTLLAMAGVGLDGRMPELDLAPAPLFLRRRHLKQRVMGLVQEARMSKTRMMVAQVVTLTAMAAACWFITGAIPLRAQAQIVQDGPGVTVNLNGSQLMHRSSLSYPAAAAVKGVEGTVVVQVRLDTNGEVIDDAVLSGPDELRKGVQQAVLGWHFDKSAGGSTRVVNIDFVKPQAPAVPSAMVVPTAVQAVVAGGRGGGVNIAPGGVVPPQGNVLQQQNDQAAVTGLLQDLVQKAKQDQAKSPSPEGDANLADLQRKLQLAMANQQLIARLDQPLKIDSIVVNGLSDSARDQLLSQLPVHAGDQFLPGGTTLKQVAEAAHQFDEHLQVSAGSTGGSGLTTIRIETPEAHAMITNTAPSRQIPPGAQLIGGNVMAANLIQPAEKPIYPPVAKMARQQGTVKFETTIGKDGHIEDLKLVSGPPLLVPAAMQAVKNWTYKPTYLNGNPVEVVSTIDVNFSLSDGTPPFAAQ